MSPEVEREVFMRFESTPPLQAEYHFSLIDEVAPVGFYIIEDPELMNDACYPRVVGRAQTHEHAVDVLLIGFICLESGQSSVQDVGEQRGLRDEHDRQGLIHVFAHVGPFFPEAHQKSIQIFLDQFLVLEVLGGNQSLLTNNLVLIVEHVDND